MPRRGLVARLLLSLLLPLPLLSTSGCWFTSSEGHRFAKTEPPRHRDPTRAATWLAEGEAFEQQGLDARAIAHYSRGLEQVHDPEALLGRAAAAAERLDDPRPAVRWLEPLTRLQPDDWGLELRLIVALARAGRAEEARRRLQELVGSGRCPVEHGQLAAAWVELHAGRLRQARALALLAQERKAAGAALLLGMVHARLGQLEAARLLLREALTEVPERWEIRLLLGELLLLGGSVSEAEAELEAVLRIRPSHARTLLWAGLVAALQQQGEQARERFEQALRAGELAAHLPLARQQASGGKPEDAAGARAHLEAYRQAFPQLADQLPIPQDGVSDMVE